jgi:hypothetical protein
MNQRSFGYTPLQKKAWRAITYDYEGLASYSDTARLYCLTDFQVAWLQSNVLYYNWLTRWTNQNATQKELDEQQAELENALMTCIQLQPSQIEYLYKEQMTQTLDEYNTLFDSGGIPELNSNTPTDFFSGDDSSDRLDALCSACNVYVRTYAQNWIQVAQATLAVVAVIGIFASITVVGGIIASVLVGGLAFITSVALDAMQDNDALDNVVCCMRDELNGRAITSANFETALDSCGFTVGSNEAIIRDIIASDLDKQDNYLSFINALGDQYVLSQIGVYSCPCAPQWSKTWLNGDGTPTVDDWTIVYGTYDSGNDRITETNVNASSDASRTEYLIPAGKTTTITKMTMTYDVSTPVPYPRTQYIRIFDDSLILIASETRIVAGVESATFSLTTDTDVPEDYKLMFQAGCRKDEYYARMDLMAVEGEGDELWV